MSMTEMLCHGESDDQLDGRVRRFSLVLVYYDESIAADDLVDKRTSDWRMNFQQPFPFQPLLCALFTLPSTVLL